MNVSQWIAATAVAVMLSPGAAHAAARELQPNGTGDDTVQLQAALSSCTDAQRPCEVSLGEGVFYTDVLLVKGFNGAIAGRGEGRTVIRPLEHRALRSTPTPFVDEPTLAQPYPVLLHFANNSKVAISRLSLEFPPQMRVTQYEVPYPGNAGLFFTTSLVAAILVDGDRDAELVMTHMTITGADNDTYDGSNIASAARFEGQIRYSHGVNQTRILQKGRLVAFESHINRSGYGIQALDAMHVDGVLAGNTMDVRIYGISLQDLGASKLAAVRNTIDAELEGILVNQTPELAPKEPSQYLIAQNKLRVNETGRAIDFDPTGGYGGVGVYDYSAQSKPPVGETIRADVTIWDNDITIPKNPVKDGIDVSGDGPGDITVVGNRIRGTPYDSGIFVDLSRGTVIADNDLRGINPPKRDVHLTSTTRDCRVIEPQDTVLDQGTNNRVIK
ncbi:MAG: hypothetical protein JWM63_1043 [Gammaproteobacteria bacterium]|jgi:hypothetical protein|nr:hypothetical protein [Gammaproteobacteria bacterium]